MSVRITAHCGMVKKSWSWKARGKKKKKKSAGVFDGSVAGAAHLTHDMLLDEIQPEKNPNHTDSMLTRRAELLQSTLITEEQTKERGTGLRCHVTIINFILSHGL